MIPKIELHVHLDGSVRPKTVSKILKRDVDFVKSQMIAPKRCVDLNDYLTKFTLVNQAMQEKEYLTQIAYELSEDLKKDHVIYAEVRFAPNKHTKYLTLEEVIDAVLMGLNRGSIKINLILCMMRNDSYEENLKIIDLAVAYKHKQVVGLDLAGAEGLYPTKNFENLFQIVREKKIPFTIHAGEADGPSSIQSAIDFGAKRIGHGIRAVEDSNLIDQILTKKILLEICPTSNIQTNIVKDYDTHPIHTLFKKGCAINISTDNRTVSNTTLEDEYRYIGFSKSDLIQTNLDSICHSFLNSKEKEQLMKLYQTKIRIK